MECTMVECVFTYSSSSHALPQTGNTPLPLLCAYVTCPLTSMRICVCVCMCVYTSSKPATCTCVCVCARASPWYFTADLCTLTSLSTCVCLRVFSLFTAERGTAGPSQWLSHSNCLFTVCLSACLSLCRRADGQITRHFLTGRNDLNTYCLF